MLSSKGDVFKHCQSRRIVRESCEENRYTDESFHSSFALWAFSRLSTMTLTNTSAPFQNITDRFWLPKAQLKYFKVFQPVKLVKQTCYWNAWGFGIALYAAIIPVSPGMRPSCDSCDRCPNAQAGKEDTMSTAVTVPYLEKRVQIASFEARLCKQA